MKRNLLLVLIGLFLHLLFYFSLYFSQFSFFTHGTNLSLLYHLEIIQNYLPLFIGVLIGFVGIHTSWRYAFLYGLFVHPVMLIMSSIFGHWSGSMYVSNIESDIFTIVIMAIQASIGGFAGERIRENRHNPAKRK